MRILYRFLAVVGAIVLCLLAYSTIRSPGGTGLTLLFLAKWWAEPLLPRQNPPSVDNPDIIKNPARDTVAGIPLSTGFKLIYQNEETSAFNGDGHAILIAEVDDDAADVIELAKAQGLSLTGMESGILDQIRFLKDTTPYPTNSDQIDEILKDEHAVYFLLGLKRNSLDISDMDIYIFSPSTKRALEWSSHF